MIDAMLAVTDFWSSVMLTTGRYKGNPLAVHLRVEGLEESMFASWLALFRATAEELLPHELAASFRVKSERIAKQRLEPGAGNGYIDRTRKAGSDEDKPFANLKIPEQSQFIVSKQRHRIFRGQACEHRIAYLKPAH
jgi:hemoglobin